jgi:hypothetical protein
VRVVRNDEDSSFAELLVSTRYTTSGLSFWDSHEVYVDGSSGIGISVVTSIDILNPFGDRNHASEPVVVVIPSGTEPQNFTSPTPLVVWSEWDGNDYEIMYSMWDEVEGWLPPEPLTHNEVDDLDPVILLDPEGTVWVAWWTDDEVDQVWLVTFSDGEWSEPELVSDPEQNSRWPDLYINEDLELIIEFSIVDGEFPIVQSLIKERFDP